MDEIRGEDRRHSRHQGRGDGAAMPGRRPASRSRSSSPATTPEALHAAALKVADGLAKRPEIRDLDNGLPMPGIDWRLEIDKAEAAKYGIGVGGVGAVVQLVTNGLKITDYRPADQRQAGRHHRPRPRGPADAQPDRRPARPDAGRRRADRQFHRARARARGSASSTASTASASSPSPPTSPRACRPRR